MRLTIIRKCEQHETLAWRISTVAQADLNQRVAMLEAEQKHLATKADIADVRTDLERLRTDFERLRSVVAGIQAEMRTLRWVLSIAVPAAIAVTGIVVGIVVQLINQGL